MNATAAHELVDHTSEITVRLRAQSFPALVAEATRAFEELVPATLRGEVRPELRQFEIEAADRPAALVEWLNEMVYLCEAEQWLPVDIESAAESGDVLRISARGVSLVQPFVGVKAATLHRARVTEEPGAVSGEVTLDV